MYIINVVTLYCLYLCLLFVKFIYRIQDIINIINCTCSVLYCYILFCIVGVPVSGLLWRAASLDGAQRAQSSGVRRPLVYENVQLTTLFVVRVVKTC